MCYGTTLTNKNEVHDDIRRRINSVNMSHYSVQEQLSPRLHSKSLKVGIQSTIIFHLFRMGMKGSILL